jgi:hypothetical protein
MSEDKKRSVAVIDDSNKDDAQASKKPKSQLNMSLSTVAMDIICAVDQLSQLHARRWNFPRFQQLL